MAETHNPPAGRNGSSPPAPPHPADAGHPLHLSEEQIAQRRRKLQKGWEVLQRFRAKKDETDPLSEEQRQRKVQKGREALQRFRATKDAKDRGSPGVAAHWGRRPPLSRHLRRTR